MLDKILFPSPVSSYDEFSFPDELCWLPTRYPVEVRNGTLVTKPGDTFLPGLFINFPSARYIILFFHSNAEDIGRSRQFLEQMANQFHVHVLAVEYPGYGIADGTVSAENVLKAADVGMEFVKEVLDWSDDSVLVMGRSIGTAPALHLAAKYPKLGGLILVSPFTSIQNIIEDKFGYFTRLLPIKERFDNLTLVPQVTCQTMIIHGQKDTIVPVAHGRDIFEGLLCRKLFVAPLHMTHNTYLFADPRLMAVPMLHFLSLPDYSLADDFRLPNWMFQCRRCNVPVDLNPEVSWDAKLQFTRQYSDNTLCPPLGDVNASPPVIKVADERRPPKSDGDGAVEDGEKTVSQLFFNSTSREGLESLRVRLPAY